MPVWAEKERFPNYNSQQVSNYLGVFAAYANNAYTPEPEIYFDLKPEVFGWRPIGKPIERAGGFQAHVYYRDTPDRLYVMTVYRGTDGFLDSDSFSNASWFTQMINPWDQYRTARTAYQQIRADAKSVAGTKSIGYLTVGHSLGGGLARHVAKAFPCTAAIVFNSSFVTNEYRLENAYTDALVIDVFEDLDVLSYAALYVNPTEFFKINKSHYWYRLNLNRAKNEHGIFKFAAHMARVPVDCWDDRECYLKDYPPPPGDYEVIFPTGKEEVDNLLCSAAPPKVRNEEELCPGGLTGQSALAQ
jgi:hypothetical protein